MKKAVIVIIFGIILLIPSYSDAIIIDSGPINIVFGWGFYEHRDDGYLGIVNGGYHQSGDYFHLQSQIVTGGLLASFDDVISVQAHHWPQGAYGLLENRSSWPNDPEVSFWTLRLRPYAWTFEGKWRFILRYTGTDDEEHKQILIFSALSPAFPAPISHVTVTKSADAFVISWSGIGNPAAQGNIDYRVLISEAAPPGNWIEDIRGDWIGGGTLPPGTYDAALNKVTFTIPKVYGGQDYLIRIAQNIGQMGRAVFYLVLPLF